MIDDLIKEWKKLITNFVNKLSAMEQSMIKQVYIVHVHEYKHSIQCIEIVIDIIFTFTKCSYHW